jgi:hypothetical protein
MSAAPAERRQPIDIEEFERRLRAPEAARVEVDPLEELARLVAGQGKSGGDPLAAIFAEPPAGSAPPIGSAKGELADFPDLSGLMRRGFDEGAPSVSPQVRDEIPYGAQAPTHPDSYQPSSRYEDWAEEAELQPDSEEPAPVRTRSRKPLYLTAAVIALGVAAIGGTLAYRGGSTNPSVSDITTIKAATGPIKVQPQGGQPDNPARDTTVLDKGVSAPPVKKLVSRDEQPIDVAAAAKTARVIPMNENGSPAASSSGAAAVPTPLPPSRGPEQAGSVFPEPKKVKTVAVRADGTIISSESAPPPPPPRPTAAPAAPEPAKNATPKTANRAAPPATTPAPPKPAAAVAPKPAAPKPAPKPAQTAAVQQDGQDDDAPAKPARTAASTGGGGFSVQLAAPGSEAEARQVAQRLGEKYSSALGGRRPSVQKASDKAIYRVRVTGLSREGATEVCEKVKSAGGACFVAR